MTFFQRLQRIEYWRRTHNCYPPEPEPPDDELERYEMFQRYIEEQAEYAEAESQRHLDQYISSELPAAEIYWHAYAQTAYTREVRIHPFANACNW